MTANDLLESFSRIQLSSWHCAELPTYALMAHWRLPRSLFESVELALHVWEKLIDSGTIRRGRDI